MRGEAGLSVTRSDGVVTVLLDRPERRNALSWETRAGLREAVREALATPGTRGLLLAGSPGVAFASGADLTEIGALTPAAAAGFSRAGQDLHEAIARAPFPSVAAIDGYCYGGGLDLALACDLRIATRRSRFRHPGSRLGILTGWGGTRRVPLLLGPGPGADLLLRGEEVGAEDALRVGLVDSLALPEDLLPRALAEIERLGERRAAGLHRLLLEAIERAGGLSFAAARARECAEIRLALAC